MALAKPTVVNADSAALLGLVANAGLVPARFPTLWSYLADVTYAGGEKRETATLTLFVEEGFVKLCLNDREQRRTCWSTGIALEVAAEALEQRLTDGTAEWRGARKQASGGKR